MARSSSSTFTAILAAVLASQCLHVALAGALQYKTVTDANPMKGWMSFYPQKPDGKTVPLSLEYAYVPLSDVFTGPSTYNWAPLETILSDVASRGHNLVFRFYMDYPGRAPAVPKFLLDSGIKASSYSYFGNGPSLSPDYNDPKLAAALETFIGALGDKYDGDARIASIMIGLLGFWGEWHTWPSTDLAPPQALKDRVSTAFAKAFTKTRIVCRYPQGAVTSLPIGYHDDSFVHETLESSGGGAFNGLMNKAGTNNVWRTQMIGGEVFPEIQKSMWNNNPAADDNGATLAESITTTHASWMIYAQAFDDGWSGDKLARLNAAARALGYELYASSASYSATSTGTLRLTVNVQNQGVAPFYYNWPVQVALRSASGAVVSQWSTAWDIRAVQPGQPFAFSTVKPLASVAKGAYTLSMRVVNPLANGVPFKFANAEMDGAWLNLGPITVA